MEILIRETKQSDLSWIREIFRRRWGGEYIVTRGNVHRPEELFGFMAEVKRKTNGLLTYRINVDNIEIISLDSLRKRQGIGRVLLNQLIDHARDLRIKRIWLITTNDNVSAQRFWQKSGFKLKKVYKDAMRISRKLKPTIPLTGENNIPIIDELEFERIF